MSLCSTAPREKGYGGANPGLSVGLARTNHLSGARAGEGESDGNCSRQGLFSAFFSWGGGTDVKITCGVNPHVVLDLQRRELRRSYIFI